MSFLSVRHVPVQAEQLLCHDVMVALFVSGGKLVQITSYFRSTDILSANLGAPNWDQILPQASMNSKEGHSLKSFNILALGGKSKKSFLLEYFHWVLQRRNCHSEWCIQRLSSWENEGDSSSRHGDSESSECQGWTANHLRSHTGYLPTS